MILRYRLLTLAVSGLLLASSPARTQVEFGGLYGSISDGNGTSLSGVSVSLAGPGASQAQVSDAQGRFRFPRLDPGRYHLTAELEGFSPLEQPDIEIRAGRTLTLQLEATAAIEDAITVTADTPLLDERKLSTGTLVSRTDLDKIPTAGDPWALLNQAPGVLVAQIDVGGADNSQGTVTAPGVDVSQNAWLIDGVPVTDMVALGLSPTTYDLEQMSQVEFSTGGNDITKPTAGVSVNMVTRRGTNELRGSARYFITDKELFWFFKQSTPDVDPDEFPPEQGTDTEGSQIERIENYGFEAGGPLLQNRFWLWGSYGTNDFSETKVGGYPFSSQTEHIAVKLNAQLSQANSLLASWNDGDKVGKDFGYGPNRSLASAFDQHGPGSTVGRVEDSHVFNSQLFLTGRWSKVDSEFRLTSNGCKAAGSCAAAPETLLDADGVWQNSLWSGFSDFPSSEWRVDGSYFLGTGNTSHELKFGGRYRDFESTSPFGWPGGRNIWHIAAENWGFEPDSGLGFFEAERSGAPTVSQSYSSLWLQDTLTRGSWTVNVGLRYDLQQGKNETSNVPANPALPELLPAVSYPGDDGGFDWESISPRLGVTYALGAVRRTLLRASYAQFASALGWEQVAHINPVYSAYATFLFADTNGNQLWDGQEEEVLRQVGFTGYDPEDPGALSSPNRTDPYLDAPLTREVVLGLEHALMPDLLVGVNLTWRNTSDILEHRDFLRVCVADSCDAGPERLARSEDYLFDGQHGVTQPNGQPYGVDIYYLDSSRYRFTGGSLLTNGDRQVEYRGASLTLVKRLSHRWMMRGFVNYGTPEWRIPPSFFTYDDPTDAPADRLEDSDNDADLFAEWSFGRDALQHSGWSFNLNGMVQLAPDRPWDFNVSGNVYGREGFSMPLWTRQRAPDDTPVLAQAMASADDFRYQDAYTVDLRIEKEFSTWGQSSFTLSADVFNALNSGVVLRRATRVDRPSWVLETLSPRIWRLGLRFNWR